MTDPLRIVFLGSADFSCPSLDSLLDLDGARLAAVVTQPDRPRGRRLHLVACPSKVHAQQAGLPVFTPDSINTPESIALLLSLEPNLLVVVAYGQILKRDVLALPTHGCINIHASLLPAYRGAAPIQWAIANGEKVTGVTSMHMDAKLDAGDVIFQRSLPILPDDTGGTLHDRLATAGAALLVDTVSAIRSGSAPRVPQDETRVTYAPKLLKEDGRIDWTAGAGRIHNRVRGFHPWPGCHCLVPRNGEGTDALRVLRTRVEPAAGPCGVVLDMAAGGPLVAAGEHAVRLLDVQPEGGKTMSGEAYLRGHPLLIGDLLL